ncbi:hypothetical protein PABG_00366 [Paracoccidioides brasiliensis Pb03]|nr:hypothetical protein PABG_00366 [Paracoccidioides brasiliensis Pb03]
MATLLATGSVDAIVDPKWREMRIAINGKTRDDIRLELYEDKNGQCLWNEEYGRIVDPLTQGLEKTAMFFLITIFKSILNVYLVAPTTNYARARSFSIVTYFSLSSPDGLDIISCHKISTKATWPNGHGT